jgi:hypothetical protein
MISTREIRVKLQLVAAELQAVDAAIAAANEARAKLRASYTELQRLDAELATLQQPMEEKNG